MAVSLSDRPAGVPAISEGSAVYLRFAGLGIEPVSDIVAFVRNYRDVSGVRVFGLEVADWRGLRSRLPPKLSSLFNRRQHYRVDVPRTPPVEVDVSQQGEPGKRTARLCDISAGGCALEFEPGDALQEEDTVTLQFCLPDSEYRYNLAGVCKSSYQSGEFQQCGIAFDSGEAEFITQQKNISQYVMERQRQLMSRGQR